LPVTERNLSFLFAASLRAWKCYPAIISPNANKAQCCQIPTSLNGWFCQKPQKESPLRRDPPPPPTTHGVICNQKSIIQMIQYVCSPCPFKSVIYLCGVLISPTSWELD
jgi:hypothetical protein